MNFQLSCTNKECPGEDGGFPRTWEASGQQEARYPGPGYDGGTVVYLDKEADGRCPDCGERGEV